MSLEPHASVPYKVVQIPNLDEWLGGRFSWQPRGEDWIFQGPCPRCGHEVSRLLSPPFLPPSEGGEQLLLMQCNCSYPHEDQPPGALGCGAFWGLAISA
jgi:hypothetical protein